MKKMIILLALISSVYLKSKSKSGLTSFSLSNRNKSQKSKTSLRDYWYSYSYPTYYSPWVTEYYYPNNAYYSDKYYYYTPSTYVFWPPYVYNPTMFYSYFFRKGQGNKPAEIISPKIKADQLKKDINTLKMEVFGSINIDLDEYGNNAKIYDEKWLNTQLKITNLIRLNDLLKISEINNGELKSNKALDKTKNGTKKQDEPIVIEENVVAYEDDFVSDEGLIVGDGELFVDYVANEPQQIVYSNEIVDSRNSTSSENNNTQNNTIANETNEEEQNVEINTNESNKEGENAEKKLEKANVKSNKVQNKIIAKNKGKKAEILPDEEPRKVNAVKGSKSVSKKMKARK